MEYDRKSAVSSFYGDRRSSVDALNRDYTAAAPTTDRRSRRDSSSSFFNPAATANLPRGATEPVRVQGAGYNRMSYFDAGREEPVKGGYDEVAQVEQQPNEGGWDVYADFNNAGPRYSHAFGLGNDEPTYVESVWPVSPLAHNPLFFFEAISSSTRLAPPSWTKSPPPRDPSNW